MLRGELVALRPIRRADLALLAEWRNDADVRVRTREHAGLTELDQERWFEAVVCAPTRTRANHMFAVEVAGELVGCVGLCYWSARDQTAEISFYVGPDARGKGYGTEALKLLIGWGFGELNLERIFAEAYQFNEPGIKLLERLGFKREGTLRSHAYRMGQRHDATMLGLLRSEWR